MLASMYLHHSSPVPSYLLSKRCWWPGGQSGVALGSTRFEAKAEPCWQWCLLRVYSVVLTLPGTRSEPSDPLLAWERRGEGSFGHVSTVLSIPRVAHVISGTTISIFCSKLGRKKHADRDSLGRFLARCNRWAVWKAPPQGQRGLRPSTDPPSSPAQGALLEYPRPFPEAAL